MRRWGDLANSQEPQQMKAGPAENPGNAKRFAGRLCRDRVRGWQCLWPRHPPTLLYLILRIMREIKTSSVLLLCLMSAAAVQTSDPNSADLCNEDAEFFLSTAEVVNREKVDIGISRPERFTLSDGVMRRDALWKSIEEYSPQQKMANGQKELSFRDSWRSEVAAYRLSLLLGLDLVPATIERRIDGQKGSLQLWLERSITEVERKQQGLHAPDVEEWNRQIATVRLFHQLIHDTDFNNINNLLVTDDFRVWVIDSSRSFNLERELRNEHALRRFSTSLLDRLRELDEATLLAELKAWLSKAQIQALLERRDRILELAERRVEELGEAAVLFP